MTGINKKAVQ